MNIIKKLLFKERVKKLYNKLYKKGDSDMKERVCPRCGNTYIDFPAISRRDNKTEICPTCGQAEALLDYMGEEDKPWKMDIK